MGFLTAAVVAGTAAVGVGTYMSTQATREQAESQKAMYAEQQKQEQLRKRAMELDARRRSMEMIRTQQRARATSLAATTGQGAQGGSGLQGAYGQTAGQTGTNLLGVSQNLEIGRAMFNSNSNISGYQMAYADAGADAAMGRGIAQLGSTVVSNAGTINQLGQAAMAWSPYGTGWSNGVPTGRNLGGYGGSWG